MCEDLLDTWYQLDLNPDANFHAMIGSDVVHSGICIVNYLTHTDAVLQSYTII
jgi:hypothetical protein